MDETYLPRGSGIVHHKEGADFLPANIGLSGMETFLVNTMSREHVLKEGISELRKDYDYILIDCMPSLGMMKINALAAADSLIVPLQPSYLSTKGLDILFKSVSRIRKTINPTLRIDGILLTFRTEAEDKLISLSNMRNLLRNELKRVTRAVDTEGIQRVKGNIAEVSEEMRKIRKQVRLCDGIEERSVSMADELQRLSEEPAREEEKNNEQLFRGRCGASRPHEPRGS